MSRRIAPVATVVLAAAGLLATAPPSAANAAAETARAYADDGGHAVYYEAAPGQTNEVVITDANGQTEFTIDDAVPIDPGAGCAHPDPADLTEVVCRLTEFGDFWTRVYADTGDQNDDLTIRAGNENAIHGGPGDDSLNGTGHELLYGDGGNDTLVGGSQSGGDGDDLLSAPDYGATGGAGNDTLIGTDADDTLYGGTGHDSLLGRAGDDTLYGNSGNDFLYGGGGTDTLSGGPGSDRLFQD
ncbi:calcium-binding protein [Streptomyces sp. Ru87]|uniref:calcium-binding protein n=1 Tax=Streptomyces sp. Ru87 TaxID=2044307 RepID=UPI00117F3D42|nr:calcium-binding protein [Streptomyces sp. Ru87]